MLAAIRETVLDLDTVTISRSRPVSAEAQARIEQHLRECDEYRVACRTEHRRLARQNVIEEWTAFGGFKLEAFGETREAVEAAIAGYQKRGPNSSRHHIRFFAINPDPDGGFIAHGTASREDY